MINNFWQTRSFLTYCLLLLTGIYKTIIALRCFCYKKGFKKITYLPVPVIVVGNITVGGTGKTPLVSWLANYLKQQGYKPGIISRGYGGKAKQYPQWVTDKSDPRSVGDESVLLARQTHCPIVVNPNRTAATKELLSKTDCNIVISDDGLQHYALGRTLEIAVIDGQKLFGNGFCLPAGPLREPIKRLEEVDFVVVNTSTSPSTGPHPALRATLPLKGEGIPGKTHPNPWGASVPQEFPMQFITKDFCLVYNPNINCTVEKLKTKIIHAVAGIGNPQRFFQTLKNLGLIINEHAFPDHYAFTANDFAFSDKDSIIIMTEKDAVKCETFADERFWYLPVQAELPTEFDEHLRLKLFISP